MKMAENQRKFKLPVNIKHFFSSFLTNSSIYRNTKLVCKDRVIFSNKLVLSLAFPIMEQLMASLGDLLEPVIILPDTADQINTMISNFLSEPEAEICDECGSSAEKETDDETKHIDETSFNTEEVFGTKLDIEKEFKDEFVDSDIDSSQVCLKEERDHHMMTCEMTINCKFCAEEFKTNEEKRSHEESFITSEGQFMCEGMLKQTCQISILRCQFCSETFETDEEIAEHLNRNKFSEGQIKCGVKNCGIIFCSKTFLMKHTRVVHSDIPMKKERKFVCEFENCGVTLKSRKTLVQHIKIVHIEKILTALRLAFFIGYELNKVVQWFFY